MTAAAPRTLSPAARVVVVRAISSDVVGPGPGPVHVVVLVREIGDALARAWQRDVVNGSRQPWEDWLETALGTSGSDSVTPRLRQDATVARWARDVGWEHVTAVIVGAEGEEPALARAAERLRGSGDGLQAPAGDDSQGLTLAETELLRRFNAEFRALGLGPRLHARVVRDGAVPQLRRRVPGQGESPHVGLPSAALDRAVALAGATTDGIRATGVDVVGDLEALASGPAHVEGDTAGLNVPERAWAEIGAAAGLGVLFASDTAHGPRRGRRQPAAAGFEPLELTRLSSRALLLLLARRALGGRLGRFGSPMKRDRRAG